MLRRALAWLLLLAAVPAAAQTFPPFTGFVVDAANVLPPEVEADLSAKLQALRHDTRRQLVVATIPDLQGYPLEDYGYRLGRSWGVGLRDVNNGIILFIAPNEPPGHRGPRIEVGKGLEPIVTDALASRIITDKMMPQLQAKDVPGAVIAGTDALIAQLRAAPEEAQARTDAAAAGYDAAHRRVDSGGSSQGVPVALIFWGVVFLFFILPALTRRRRGSRWSGGGGSNWPIALWAIGNELGRGAGGGGWSGGGGGSSGSDSSWTGDFGGGGGGSFGGGGASGEW